MRREREQRATEAGVLAEVVQQAVEAKRARPQHFSVLLVRLLQPKDKPSASVMRAAAESSARCEDCHGPSNGAATLFGWLWPHANPYPALRSACSHLVPVHEPSVYPTRLPYEKVSSCSPGGVITGPVGGLTSGKRALTSRSCADFVTMAQV